MFGKLLPMEVMLKEIGRFLRQRREALDFTQNDVSEISGVAERTIRSIEGGQNTNLANLMKVADVLGLEIGLQLKKTLHEQ
jgi:transcriptional regulator with XRE-family HTH domain